MKILILGAGAIGGYYGGRLVQAGADVSFMVRAERANILAQNGLIIKSGLGDFSSKIKITLAGKACSDYDIIIIACKAYDLDSALDSLKSAVSNKAVIIPLLNGVKHIDKISSTYPFAECWPGLAKISTTLTTDGEIHQFDNVNQIIFGTIDGREDNRAKELVNLFRKQSVDASFSVRIKNDLWEKFTFLSTLAGITCLMRGSIDEILQVPSGKRLITQLLTECSEVSKAEGFPLEPHIFTQYLDHLVGPSFGLKSSMLRDIERAHKTEVEHILGDMLERAERLQLSAPLLAIATAHVRTFERQLANCEEN